MKRLFSPWWLLLLAVAGAAALALVYANVWSLPLHGNGDKLGQMGDFFGGLLNPLVSLLTLFVAISVWQLQREELKLTRDELEQTKLAMKDQAKTAEQQRQKQRFFDLLNVYLRTVESISHERPRGMGSNSERIVVHGKSAISDWLHQTGVGGTNVGIVLMNDPDMLKKLLTDWNGPGMFDQYFRVVFRILSEANALLGDQHVRYIKLFRAQLSQSELIILAYDLWLDEEGKKMMPMAERYGLLKHLPKGDLRTSLEQELPAQVFGRTRAAELATAPTPADRQPHA